MIRKPKKRNTRKAFHWIVGLLNKHKVRFMIVGGFAAKCYGAKRLLDDIDLDVDRKAFNRILPEVKKFITWGPASMKNECWDIKCEVDLKYAGQAIDLSLTDKTWVDKIYNPKTKKWVRYPGTYKRVNYMTVYGLRIPVIDPQDLITYKKILGMTRRYQKQDVAAVEKWVKNNQTIQ